MVQIYEEQHTIHGTLYFNGRPYELLRPAPIQVTSVMWKHPNTFLFFVVNPDGFGTYIYVHGEFIVDLSTQGAVRTVKFTVDDEKEAQSQSILDNRIQMIVKP